MKLIIVFLTIDIIWNCQAQVARSEVMESLVFQNLGQCKCRDKLPSCQYYQQMCKSVFVYAMCPVSCFRCKECPPPPTTKAPALPLRPCQMNCTDVWPQEMCARYRRSGQCSALKSYCDQTCGECRKCVLPPAKECSEDCEDMADVYSCTDWKNQGKCIDSSSSDVRYVCQRTCEECMPCRGDGTTSLRCG